MRMIFCREMQSVNKRQLYHHALALILWILCLGLLYIRLRGEDYVCITDTEPGYVMDEMDAEGNTILAEGCKRIYLQPGSYHLEVQAVTENDNVILQVYNKWNNTILVETPYMVGEGLHEVEFSTEEVCEEVVVRSLSQNTDAAIEIYEYDLQSNAPVCEDARWSAILIALLTGGLYLEYVYAARHRRFACLILTVSAATLAMPFFSRNLQYGHNIPFHMTRIANIARAISQGYFPERLNVLAGGDSIIPIMYPETFLVPAGLMVSMGATVMLAYKVLCAGITFATAYVAYYAARQILDERSALLFAILWLFNPFRMDELFVRAAIGEALAILFLPLVATGMWQVMHGCCKRGSAMLVLGYVGILSSHMLTAVIAAFFCLLYVMGAFLVHPRCFLAHIQRILYFFISAILVLLIKAYWLVPFLSYYGWDLYLSSGIEAERVQDSTSPLWQLYMGAAPYGKNLQTTELRGELPISAGLACLAGAIGWILYVSWKRYSAAEGAVGITQTQRQMTGTAIALSAVATFMASRYFPWDYLNNNYALFARTLGSMQFSWRLMMIPACLLTCVLTVLLVHLVRERSVWMRMLATLLMACAVITAAQTMTYYYSENDSRYADHFDNVIQENRDYILRNANINHQDELYDWLHEWPIGSLTDDAVTVLRYGRDGINYEMTVTNTGDGDAILTVPVFWYGLHRAVMANDADEQVLTCAMNPEYQLTEITIPAGVTEATIRLEYVEPRSYRMSYLISGATVLLILAGVIRVKLKGHKMSMQMH